MIFRIIDRSFQFGASGEIKNVKSHWQCAAAPDKSYLRIEQSKRSDKNNLTLTAFGGLIFEDIMQARCNTGLG